MPQTSSVAARDDVSWIEYRIYGPLTFALSCFALTSLGASVVRRLERQQARPAAVVAAEAVTAAASVGVFWGLGQFVRRTLLWPLR